MTKELTDQEKISFIIKIEMEIIQAMAKGHRPNNQDQFAQDRELIEQYRKELGLRE